MTKKTIDHATLSKLVKAGTVSDAHVIGSGGGWFVAVRHQGAEPVLTAQRTGRFRFFRRMDTRAAYLKEIGISHFDVDAREYDANAHGTRVRHGRADAWRRARAGASHGTWFRGEVEAALALAES